MSNTCNISLYSRKNNTLDFIKDIVKESTLDNVAENVASFLKREASFATSITVAEDLEGYEDNIINQLIPNLISEIQKGLNMVFSPVVLSRIQGELKQQFLPKIESTEKLDIPTTETREEKEQKKQSVTLRLLRNSIFKGSNLLSGYHQKEFTKLIQKTVIFNPNKKQRSLVYDLRTLNENLKLYKLNLYETIYQYCRENGIEVPQHRSYYTRDNQVKGEETLDAFYKYLMGMDSNERLGLLEKSWEDITLLRETKNVRLLDAVNAYITLNKFDELIKSTVGNYIQINYRLDEPINNIEHNGTVDIKYKYNFGRKQSNLLKDFRDVIQNALDTMGNFSKFLIESIPRINSTENLTQILFINAMIHLRIALRRLADIEKNLDYKEAVRNLHKDPKENWKIILDKFANESNYDEFIASGLTSEDINILLSVQNYVYGKSKKDLENSLYSLENEVHNLVGYKELYSLVDTILGTIDSISEINYLETAWDYNTNMPVVRVKRKYFNNKQKLDLISGINQESSRPLSLALKQKYKISYIGGPFTFNIGGSVITIKPKSYSEFGIFDKNLEVTIDGKSLSSYFRDVNLVGSENRKAVLESTGTLSTGTNAEISQDKLNRKFLDLLKYIDGALTTGLAINNESLLKFFIYDTLSEKGLEDLVVAASRTYLVKDIQRKFLESIDAKEINPETGNPYNKKNIHDWIKNNISQVPVVLFAKEKNKENKIYFGVLLGIPYLKPVQYNEEWVDRLGDALAVLMGESLKAVTKNFDGENIPNYSPAFLGADVWEMMERNNENPTTKRLLFSSNPDAIKNVIIDTDVRTANGDTKQIKNMTEAELLYHFFVNKFIIPFRLSDEKPYRSFYSLPTVYSDKSKFIGYDVSLESIGITSLSDDDQIITLIQNSLGSYFSESLKNVLKDYHNLFNIPVEMSPSGEYIYNIQAVQDALKSRTLKQLMDEVVAYNRNHPDAPIELIELLHYRQVGGKLGLNETLIYRNEHFFKNLKQYLETATQDYVNTLLNSGVIFDTNAGFMTALSDVATSANVKIKEWIDSNGMLILAKRHTEDGDINIIAGEEIHNFDGVEINPLLRKYTLLHNLINNNLKEGLFGTDSIHKVKPKMAKLSKVDKQLLGLDLNTEYDLTDAFLASLRNLNEFLRGLGPDATEDDLNTLLSYVNLENKINSQIESLESDASQAQLKRTVTGPGTMRYYLLNTLTGILPVLKGAVILDVHASVHNFEGEVKENLEAHDGEALLNPITAVWQNNSLQDSEVGDVIKPLWLVEIPTYGGKRLVKYAADTITNSMMENSEFSEISMYHMFKKMTNVSWDGLYWSDSKNLFNQYMHRRNNNQVDFSDITQSSGSLYYNIGDKTFQIIDIGFEDGAYYTEELEVRVLNSNNQVVSVKDSNVLYYHYFDAQGNHYKVREGEPLPEGFTLVDDIKQLKEPGKLHTINNIYELHKVFGGIYSKSFKDGRFVTSDASIKATASLLNMVSERTEEYDKAILSGRNARDIPDTLTYYYQPLKYKMIDYLINQSAIKNGTGNINFSTTYLNPENELNDPANDEPLRYIEMDTQRYGIQLDSEHEADDEELTEMSQVISAIDAGGFYHSEVSELYKAIGHLALEAAKVELSKIQLFRSSNNQNQDILYDLIGRVLIEHLSLNRGQNGIAESLVDRIKKHFGTSTDHSFDDIKIAFSDLSIYNQIISTLSSILNKKSVKRKFPGTGLVMAAGYNIVLLWNIDGRPARYEDLLKEAIAEGYTSTSTSPELYNKDIVRQYLQNRQAKFAEINTKVIPLKTDGTDYDEDFWEKLLQNIRPIDIVQCTVDGVTLKPVKLDKIRDYYQFKRSPILYLLDKKMIDAVPKELQVVRRIDIPSNLAPLQYNFVYIDGDGNRRKKDVYDIWAVKDMYFIPEFQKSLLKLSPNDKVLLLELINYAENDIPIDPTQYSLTAWSIWTLKDKYFSSHELMKNLLDANVSNYEKSKLLELEKIRLRRIEQDVLNRLEKNKYIDRDGTEYDIVKQESNAAQTLMSNIFKTKFGLKAGESLYDILKEGPKRFVKSPLKMLPNENIYDLAMLKSNGEGVLIAFNDDKIDSVQGFYKVKEKGFLNINEHEVVEGDDGLYYDTISREQVQGKTADGQDIYSYIYALDSNNMEIMPVAIKIDVTDKIEFNGEDYVYKDTKKKVSQDLDLTRKGDKILQTIEFVGKQLVSPRHKEKYTVYNVKNKLITSLLGEKYVQKIVQGLYLLDNYTYIMPARFVNPSNIKVIDSSIKGIRANTEDRDIKLYLKAFAGALSHIEQSSEDTQGLVQIKGYNTIFKDYNTKLAEKVFSSFKESLFFISSRIPAQSLQSFMKMECIGFTNSEANIAYVSHWQAWLQGSDYDIDKSYMLGNEFDDNGLYQGWSPLFNSLYMEESKKLPYPTGVKCYMPKGQFEMGVSIEEFVDEYLQIEESDERAKLELLGRLIKYINRQAIEYSDDFKTDVILIANYDDDRVLTRRELLNLVRKHNSYTKGLKVTEASLKNFISNKLQRIIQGTSNFIGSHAPITMDYLHEAADEGSPVKKWSVSNPGYIPLMQTQAMVGKKGVGIAANGQKASFIWKYWMTDCINNNNPYKEFVRFPKDFHINRIEGRFGGKIEDRYIKRLPDINMDNASEEDRLFFEYNENHYIPSDQMSSQMISAATDNAKELILDRINANTDLSKMYMYLITLGFDVKDIVKFMTSDAINLIARNSTLNIFLNTNFRTKDVANYILNKIDDILEQDLEKKSDRRITNSITSKYSFVLDSKVKALLGSVSDLQELQNIKEDVEEFVKIYELSEEFSYAGRFLGINGGVPTTKESLIDFKKFIKNMFSSRELYVGLKKRVKGKFLVGDLSAIPEDLRDLVDNIDVDKYLSDAEYRNTAIRYYELIKGSVNIPAMVEGTEQFLSILSIADVVNTVDGYGIAKSKAQNIIYNKILQKFPYTDSKYAMQILPILNQVFISEFIENNPVEIPVNEGWKYLSKKWEIKNFEENGNFTMGDESYGLPTNVSLSSFHYLMDEFIIPQLKNGELFDLKDNAFIQNLIPIIDGTEVRYKINIDMRAALTNPESKVILKDIIKGLQELQNYEFGNRTLLDIFMLYSLVVDLNRQGSDRLTDLFTTFVAETNTNNNLLLDYYKFMGEIEHNNSNFISKIEELSVNGFLVSLASQVPSIEGHTEPSVKTVSPEGEIDYLFNIGFGSYKSFGNFLPRIALEDPDSKLLRIATREQYKFGLIYDGYILDTLDNFRNLDNPEMWLQTLKDLLAEGNVDLYPECE